jgi:hypothetical protein
MAENNANNQHDWSGEDLAEGLLKSSLLATLGWVLTNVIREAKKQ